MAQKDRIEKILEEYNDVFADIVNVLGFEGYLAVSQDSLRTGPTASVYQDRQGSNREQFRDAVVQNYQSHHKEGEMEMSCSLLDYIENKGISEGLSQGFQALIETCRELGQDYDSTMKRLTDKFSLTQEQAKEVMDKYWRF